MAWKLSPNIPSQPRPLYTYLKLQKFNVRPIEKNLSLISTWKLFQQLFSCQCNACVNIADIQLWTFVYNIIAFTRVIITQREHLL